MTGKVNNGKTISGTLEFGVEYQGQTHKDFVLRLSTVGDEIDVADSDVPDAGYGVAVMAVCLVSLGTIPNSQINYLLLRDHLLSEDYTLLGKKRDELKKKLRDTSANTATSDTPASGLENTVTQSKTSAPLAL